MLGELNSNPYHSMINAETVFIYAMSILSYLLQF